MKPSNTRAKVPAKAPEAEKRPGITASREYQRALRALPKPVESSNRRPTWKEQLAKQVAR